MMYHYYEIEATPSSPNLTDLTNFGTILEHCKDEYNNISPYATNPKRLLSQKVTKQKISWVLESRAEIPTNQISRAMRVYINKLLEYPNIAAYVNRKRLFIMTAKEISNNRPQPPKTLSVEEFTGLTTDEKLVYFYKLILPLVDTADTNTTDAE